MSGYCVTANVMAFLPSGGLPNPARVATASATGDYLECEGHGLTDGAEVTLRAMTGGSVPTGLTEGTTYYAIVISASRFKLATTPSGSAINLTDDGDNFVVSYDLPWSQWIEWGGRQVDSFLPEHVIPLREPYPEIVVTANAELAAMRGLQATGGASIDIGARIDAVGARVTRWAKTLPIRGVEVQRHQPANLAVTAAAGAYDPRGWGGSDDTRIP